MNKIFSNKRQLELRLRYTVTRFVRSKHEMGLLQVHDLNLFLYSVVPD